MTYLICMTILYILNYGSRRIIYWKHKIFYWYLKTLMKGIGDTIRVSLSADPVEEIKVGFEILNALGIRSRGVQIISPFLCQTSFPSNRYSKNFRKKTFSYKKIYNSLYYRMCCEWTRRSCTN